VKSSHGPKLVLALALAVTVPLKAVKLDTGKQTTSHDLRAATIAFLARHGFEPRTQEEPIGFLIFASSDDCRLQIREAFPQWWFRDSNTARAPKEARLTFVFGGELSSDIRVAWSLNYYWVRLQQQLGLQANWKAILAVAASHGCFIEALPWNERPN
jgi:hypothetical protein